MPSSNGYITAKRPVAVKVRFQTISATATRSCGFLLPFDGEVIDLYVCDKTAITGDNTNRYALSFNKGTVASPTAITTLDFVAATNLTANVPRQVALSAISETTKRVTTTDNLHVVATKNGSAANLDDFEVTFLVAPAYDYGNQTS